MYSVLYIDRRALMILIAVSLFQNFSFQDYLKIITFSFNFNEDELTKLFFHFFKF